MFAQQTSGWKALDNQPAGEEVGLLQVSTEVYGLVLWVFTGIEGRATLGQGAQEAVVPHSRQKLHAAL